MGRRLDRFADGDRLRAGPGVGVPQPVDPGPRRPARPDRLDHLVGSARQRRQPRAPLPVRDPRRRGAGLRSAAGLHREVGRPGAAARAAAGAGRRRHAAVHLDPGPDHQAQRRRRSWRLAPAARGRRRRLGHRLRPVDQAAADPPRAGPDRPRRGAGGRGDRRELRRGQLRRHDADGSSTVPCRPGRPPGHGRLIRRNRRVGRRVDPDPGRTVDGRAAAERHAVRHRRAAGRRWLGEPGRPAQDRQRRHRQGDRRRQRDPLHREGHPRLPGRPRRGAGPVGAQDRSGLQQRWLPVRAQQPRRFEHGHHLRTAARGATAHQERHPAAARRLPDHRSDRPERPRRLPGRARHGRGQGLPDLAERHLRRRRGSRWVPDARSRPGAGRR